MIIILIITILITIFEAQADNRFPYPVLESPASREGHCTRSHLTSIHAYTIYKLILYN